MTTTSETADAGEPSEGQGGRKKLIIAGAAALVLALAGGGAYFLLGGASAPVTTPEGVLSEPDPYFHTLEPITVNLNTEGAEPEFLQLEIALEMSGENQLDIIAPRMPRVIDAFQVYLRELRRSDLEGSAGVYRLKEELLRRINIAVHPAVVDDILFQNLLVQ